MVSARRRLITGILGALPLLLLAAPSWAYVDLAPTLPKVMAESNRISLVEVVSFNRATHELVLKEVRGLKGEANWQGNGVQANEIHQIVAPADGGVVPRQIVEWASPGSRGVLF